MDDAVFDPATTLSEKARRRQERKANRRKPPTQQKDLTPRTYNQKVLLESLSNYPVVFAIGPEGTGKTYLPARVAMRNLISPHSQIDKIYITRPTVAQKRHVQGFLPGGSAAKNKPWLIPIMDAFRDEVSQAQIDKLTQEGKIEIVPFEFMRGRTFHNAVVLLDEAQNCTFSDLKLFITRTGDNAAIAISGDYYQCDIEDSGLERVTNMVSRHDLNAAVVEFGEDDVVRSEVSAEWVKAFYRELRRPH